jgi:hypothetical protein
MSPDGAEGDATLARTVTSLVVSSHIHVPHALHIAKRFDVSAIT